MKCIPFIVGLKIFVFFILLLPKIVKSYEHFSINDENVSFIVDVCKFYGTRSAIFVYSDSIKEMEMEMNEKIYKWTRALSREGYMTTKFQFSRLHESLYYVKKIVQPLYVTLISNYKAIDEFSLATRNFDMSFPVWLVIFIYKGNNSNYCHSPSGNIFNLKFNSQMMVRCGKENILREWYSIGNNRTETYNVASWRLGKGISITAPSTLYDRRWNLQGLVMRAVLVKEAPFFYVNKDGNFDGIFGRVMRELCTTLNFSINVVSEVNEYGGLNSKTNSWSGAVGEIYSGRADISPSGFSMFNARLNAVDFTLPIVICTDILYFKDPYTLAIKWSTYLLVFSCSILIGVLGILIVTSIALIILKIKTGTDRNIEYLLSDNFLEIWGILCQQGLSDFPDKSPLRIMYFSLFLFAIVLSAAYSASLISSLTNVIHLLPFDSLESFVQDGTYQLAVFRGTTEHEMLINSDLPILEKVMKFMIEEDKLPVTIPEGIKKLCEDQKLAIYASNEVLKMENLEIPCKLASIDIGRVDSLGIILSKNNPYTYVINFHLRKLINNGMMYRLKETGFKKKFIDKLDHKPVHITAVISLIFLIVIASVLSICICIVEKYIFTQNTKMKSMVKRISYN